MPAWKKSFAQKKSKSGFFFLGGLFAAPDWDGASSLFPRNSFRQIFFFSKKKIGSPRLSSPSFPGRGKKLGNAWDGAEWFFFLRSWKKDISLQGCVGLPPFKETGRRFFFKKKIWGKPLWVTRVRYVHPPPLIIPSHEKMWCRKTLLDLALL